MSNKSRPNSSTSFIAMHLLPSAKPIKCVAVDYIGYNSVLGAQGGLAALGDVLCPRHLRKFRAPV